MMDELINKINELKKKKNATILVHNYQRPEIYKVADFIGDSLELARKAQSVESDIIVFCGVDFMAESAKILNPTKKVLIPSKLANCPMAAMADPEMILKEKAKYDDVAVVSYVNTNGATKAVSDICCTSANSIKVVNSLKEKNIIFVPDKNLAAYTQRFTDKNIIPWEGHCYVHNKITKDMVIEAKKNHPDAIVIAHPECPAEIIDLSDHVVSTSGMSVVANESSASEFIIATECGMIERLKELCPGKKFFTIGGTCLQMKKNDLHKTYDCLLNELNEVTVDESVAENAKKALERMLNI